MEDDKSAIFFPDFYHFLLQILTNFSHAALIFGVAASHGGPKVFQNDAYRGKENHSLTRTARSAPLRSAPLAALVSE